MSDIVENAHAQWAKAYAAKDVEALASLYSEKALFYGSNPVLKTGRQGVRDYFNGMPKSSDARSAEFSEIIETQLAPDVISIAGLATFRSGSNPPHTRRLTQVLVREDGVWRIASHHASVEAPRS